LYDNFARIMVMMRVLAVLFILHNGFAAQESTQNLPELNSFLKTFARNCEATGGFRANTPTDSRKQKSSWIKRETRRKPR